MNKITLFFKPIYFLALIAFVSFTIIGCSSKHSMHNEKLASEVSIKELGGTNINSYVSTYGSVMPFKTVDLNSEITGVYLLHINPATGKVYKLGDKVRKGAVIISFSDEEYINQVGVESKKLNYDLAVQEKKKKAALYEKGGVTLMDLRQSDVKVANAKTSYANSVLSMGKMKVVVPFTGVITDLPYFTSNVSVQQNKLVAQIMNYTQLYMDCNLPESAINKIVKDQMVAYTHYTLKNDTLRGKVSEISPAVSMQTRTFKTRLLVNNEKLRIRPGMFLKADICTKTSQDAIVIDKDIVMTSRNKKYVFVAEKNIAKRKDVKTGIETDHTIEIISGLKKTDLLIVKGYETLKNNAKIKINR